MRTRADRAFLHPRPAARARPSERCRAATCKRSWSPANCREQPKAAPGQSADAWRRSRRHPVHLEILTEARDGGARLCSSVRPTYPNFWRSPIGSSFSIAARSSPPSSNSDDLTAETLGTYMLGLRARTPKPCGQPSMSSTSPVPAGRMIGQRNRPRPDRAWSSRSPSPSWLFSSPRQIPAPHSRRC